MSDLRKGVREIIATGCGCDRPCGGRMSVLDCGCLNDADAAIALALEEAARVAETSVRQQCCMNYVGGYTSPPECCGNPDVTPMYPNEIAAAIRALAIADRPKT